MKAGKKIFWGILHRNARGLAKELHVPVNWHHFLSTESWIFKTVHHCVTTSAYFRDTSRGQGPFQKSGGWKSAETLPCRTAHRSTGVPLGARHNNGEKREGWWWKMDVCGGCVPYGALLGSNNPGSGSQIPNPSFRPSAGRQESWPQISIYTFFTLLHEGFLWALHFADKIQGAFVHQNFISMFVALSVAV